MGLTQRTYEEADLRAGSEKCKICLGEYCIGDVICVLPCDKTHFFHKSCAVPVLKKQYLCPVCNSNLFQHKNSSSTGQNLASDGNADVNLS